jgi:hypothetical protein
MDYVARCVGGAITDSCALGGSLLHPRPHPKTTLDDVVEYLIEEQLLEEKVEAPEVKVQMWEFKSASGGGTYIVTLNKHGNPKCNCPGTWRSKGRCKHVKEVEKELGIEK